MSTITAVRDKIAVKLGEMRTLKSVSKWETSNVAGNYPHATVSLREGDGSFGSTSHNVRRRGFTVRIYQERAKIGQGPENAEGIVTDIMDELETAFDMDTTLSGTVKWVRPVSWDARYVDRELDTRILEVDIDAIDIVDSL